MHLHLLRLPTICRQETAPLRTQAETLFSISCLVVQQGTHHTGGGKHDTGGGEYVDKPAPYGAGVAALVQVVEIGDPAAVCLFVQGLTRVQIDGQPAISAVLFMLIGSDGPRSVPPPRGEKRDFILGVMSSCTRDSSSELCAECCN